MATKFKIGDIVQLKSGGPEMTVNDIPREYSDYYICQWFAGKKLESGNFNAASLKLVSDTE
ncbi:MULTISPECIES: YodC family protein [Paraburkholderia]|uniref:YodC family protein n=1 Tax=Paraburkholderia TaxID=1822464 RepID=UPI002259CE8E|nr:MULTISPECIES: YodC family protein [Paraburkholderia]MCX4170686.1 YodC family protein [Paraburkholderia madseniana]MDQ6458698.1 YodC family protein [Paraburkholderia madseniana]